MNEDTSRGGNGRGNHRVGYRRCRTGSVHRRRTPLHHYVKLTRSQTAAVAQTGVAAMFAATPPLPTVYNGPWLGNTIQETANQAARTGGCISVRVFGNGTGNYTNVVTYYPSRFCAP